MTRLCCRGEWRRDLWAGACLLAAALGTATCAEELPARSDAGPISVQDAAALDLARADLGRRGDRAPADFGAEELRPDRGATLDRGLRDRLPAELPHAERSPTDLWAADTGAADAGAADAGLADGPSADHTGADAGYQRGSLADCWTDPGCSRVMAVGHGGLWSVSSVPYGSNAALAAAWEIGMDGVKVDVRVTADDVPVISHSSPIEIWESLDCYGERIEEMTAAEVTSCHRLPGGDETFQRLDEVLEYLRGKMVVQLCVKEPVDYARTIQEIHALAAEDFAFIELSPAELRDIIPALPGADAVYYLVNVAGDLAALDALLDATRHPMAFMFEFDPEVDLGDLVDSRLHPAGVRSFTYEDSQTATVNRLRALYEAGYDVLSANAADNAVQARDLVKQSRGVEPP